MARDPRLPCRLCGKSTAADSLIPCETFKPDDTLLCEDCCGCVSCGEAFESGALVIRAGNGFAHIRCPGVPECP